MAAASVNPARPRKRRAALIGLGLLALVPAWLVWLRTADAHRDIVYWDELDTALNLVLRLNAGVTPAEFCRELFADNNGHRMVTSRLLFAGLYGATGRLDFGLLDWIGILAIVGTCVLLVRSVRGINRRLLLALLVSAAVFNLGHYENFLWSGSSIDHFTVVLLATASLASLAAGGRAGNASAFVLAMLCTLTLAQGLAVWPAGMLLLAAAGRGPRELAAWAVTGAAATALYLGALGSHRPELAALATPAGLRAAAEYGLALLGSPPALGRRELAPFLGAILLALMAISWRRHGFRREPLTSAVAAFALVATALVAAGRASVNGGEIHSRYQILGAITWAVALYRALAPAPRCEPSLRRLVTTAACLAAFVISADREFADEVDSWLTCRDIAAVTYIRDGADGRGPFTLHPRPDHSTHLLQEAKKLGIYELEEICREQAFPRGARETDRLFYHLEEVAVTPVSASVRGWAGIPGRRFARGAVNIILQSGAERHVFDAVTVPRKDVPEVMGRPEWDRAGFQFARELADLPAGEFRVGLLVQDGGRAEYVLTGATLRIPPAEARSAQQ